MNDAQAAPLITDPNIDRPDDFYQALIDAHRDLSEADSLRLNSRLILILANQVGSTERLLEAIDLARTTLEVPRLERDAD
jgi:hypothetical protein